ncbi:MAG TPA: ParB/RepB/Spo0J family partition protein [Thermoanaerobaculia bacterium]|nr:ParB/RepB/Spo0J family partition protein [Thermoanaerobaculia bacterium]
MTQKQALGRGLSALLPGRDEVPRETGAREVEIGRLVPNRFQPRREFREGSLAELAASIREQGIVQPIVVTTRGEKLEIVAGERRWRAAAIAGLTKVPVVWRERQSESDLLEAALVENLQREDLNPLDAAEAYARLKDEFRFSHERIADRVGKDRTTVTNALRLLKLPESVRGRIRSGLLSAGHARALVSLISADDQERLAEEILRRGLSVRQTEKRVASFGSADKLRKERRRDPFTHDAEEKLSRRLRARVRIVRRRRGGRVEIAFASEDELIGLFERLSRA